jgi:hypothetical protein
MVLNQRQKYITWKDANNNIKVFIPKTIKNINTQAKNISDFNQEKCGKIGIYNSRLAFNSKPLQHYRSTLDKTYCKYEYILINKTCQEDGLCPSSLIIKRASTVIDASYSQNTQDFLYKRGKTFNQNQTNQIKYSMHGCINYKATIKYNNNNHMTNGPLTSSARIAGLKYVLCQDNTLSNCKVIQQTEEKCDKNCNYITKKSGKKIRQINS